MEYDKSFANEFLADVTIHPEYAARLDAPFVGQEGLRQELARVRWPTADPSWPSYLRGADAQTSRNRAGLDSGDGTRKSKNLAVHPACSVAVRLPGIDVTLEGTAAHVTDAQTLERVAALYRQLGWPADVDAAARAFTAPFSAAQGRRRGSCIDWCSTQRLASPLRSHSARRGGALLEVENLTSEDTEAGDKPTLRGDVQLLSSELSSRRTASASMARSSTRGRCLSGP